MISEYTGTQADWDDAVAHPIQSFQWGTIRQTHGIHVVRHTDGTHCWQMTIHTIPFTSWKLGVVWRSPLPTDEYLVFLQTYARAQEIINITFEPLVLAQDSLHIPPQLCAATGIWPRYTQVLDLTPHEDMLLAACHPKTRYNIRLATKKGVVVRECSDDAGYAVFERLYFETCARQKYHGHTPAYHREIWRQLAGKTGPLTGHILIAYLGEEPLAAYQLWKFRHTWYYPYGGSSLAHRNVMGANLLMWEAIRLGKKAGCTTFDMWGSLPPGYATDDPWAGFTRFKEGYGTQFREYVGAYDLTVDQTKYQLFRWVDRVRRRVV